MQALLQEHTENARGSRAWYEEAFAALQLQPEFAASKAIDAVRHASFQRFVELGIPTSAREDWKYTNLAAALKGSFALPTKSDDTVDVTRLERASIAEYAENKLVFVNGRFSCSLSNYTLKKDGVTITCLREALRTKTTDAANAVKRFEELLSGATIAESDALTALNTALFEDALLIDLDRRADLGTLQVVLVTTARGQVATFPKIFVVCGPESRGTLIETYVGQQAELSYFTCAAVDISVAENARFEHVKIGRESKKAVHFGCVTVRQASNSHYTSNAFSFGGGVVRNEIRPLLDGEGIETFLNGLTVINGNQHVDNHTVIDHAKPNCFSREVYKGVYDQKSSGVFSGTIIVRPDAQKTNAIQSNQTILLSTEATVETQPQLKIFANDVKCTHGATVGQLDDDALFYLRARGIPEQAARNMLVHAFVGAVLEHVSQAPVRDSLEKMLSEQLPL